MSAGFFDMDLLLTHAIPIALFLIGILACFFLGHLTRKEPSRGFLPTLFFWLAVLLSSGLVFYLLSIGAGISLILPVVLLCLFGALV